MTVTARNTNLIIKNAQNMRQKEIKKPMTLENIAYFDASAYIPKINRPKEFIYNTKAFPFLTSNQ